MLYNERLKKLRKEQNLNQKDIADILNISLKTYSHYETEYAVMPLKYLNTLCNYFNVSLDYIMGFTNTPNYEENKKDIDNNLSKSRLKEIRKDYNITQNVMAATLKTSQSVIAGFETGKYLISTSYLYDTCYEYNVSADYILGKTDSPKYLKK